MRRQAIEILCILICSVQFTACKVEKGDVRGKNTESGWTMFCRSEDFLERTLNLFGRTLLLDRYLQNDDLKGKEKFMPEGEISKGIDESWNVGDSYVNTFYRIVPDKKSLTEIGARWSAVGRFYTGDSLEIVCIDEMRWEIHGFNYDNGVRVASQHLQVEYAEGDLSLPPDSVRLCVSGTGIYDIKSDYPPVNIEVSFTIDRPLERLGLVHNFEYTFIAGSVHLKAFDKRTGREQQASAEIEELPLYERMIRIVSDGFTDLY